MAAVAKTFRTLGWLVGIVLCVALLAYALGFVVNLNDQPPSAETKMLATQQPSTPAVTDPGNAYLYILGFAAAPDADPAIAGLERHRWMLAATAEPNSEANAPPEDYDYRGLRSDEVAELAEACSRAEAECARLFEAGHSSVEQWLADEQWLLDRYRSLIAMNEFQEATLFDPMAPIPPYGAVFEGQKLLMAQGWRAASAGDAEAVRTALESDLVFWRIVLENSDGLVSKMVATSAIIRHFKLGNLVLREVPPDIAPTAVPASWWVEISDEERSMLRCFAGEWRFFDHALQSVADNAIAGALGTANAGAWDRLLGTAMKPFWQPQDISNRHARMMIDLANLYAVPFEDIPNAVRMAETLQASTHEPRSRLYNPIGNIVLSLGFSSFSNYAVRVSDLEGIRRAAIAVADLRAAAVEPQDVAVQLESSPRRNPYTGEAFKWQAENGSVTFKGLEPHERSLHALIY